MDINIFTICFSPSSERFNRSFPGVSPSIPLHKYEPFCQLIWHRWPDLLTSGDIIKIPLVIYMPNRHHWNIFPVTSVVLPEATENWIVVINSKRKSFRETRSTIKGTSSVTRKLLTRDRLTVTTELYSINYSTWSKFY